MKKPFRSLALASVGLLLAAACQPQTKPAAVVRAKQAVATPKVLLDAVAPANLDTPSEWIDTKVGAPVPDFRSFLAANNLAPLWQADFGQSDYNSSRPTILDGFYGAEHRHISFIFDRVEQDAVQPNLFRVQGRSRFRKNILPFAGSITVEGIKTMKVFLDVDSAARATAQAYTAKARFVLQEDSTAAGAGTFRGTAQLDFTRLASGKLDLVQTVQVPDVVAPAKGSGLLFRGQWQSNRTGQRKAVAFAVFPKAVLPNTMADFYLGDRSENINPKYAGLDWNEAWENEEWWAKSPKPSLNL